MLTIFLILYLYATSTPVLLQENNKEQCGMGLWDKTFPIGYVNINRFGIISGVIMEVFIGRAGFIGRSTYIFLTCNKQPR